MKLLKFIVGVLALLPALANANQGSEASHTYFAQAHLGFTKASRHGYDAAGAGQISIGAQLAGLEIAGGYSWLGKLESKRTDDTHISVDGVYLGVTKRFPIFGRFSLGPQLGVINWNADAKFDGANKGSDDGNSVWLGISGQVKFLDRLALNINTQRINNVSGSHLYFVSSGLLFRF